MAHSTIYFGKASLVAIVIFGFMNLTTAKSQATPDSNYYGYYANSNPAYGICGKAGEGVFVFSEADGTEWPGKSSGVSLGAAQAKAESDCVAANGRCSERHGSVLPAC